MVAVKDRKIGSLYQEGGTQALLYYYMASSKSVGVFVQIWPPVSGVAIIPGSGSDVKHIRWENVWPIEQGLYTAPAKKTHKSIDPGMYPNAHKHQIIKRLWKVKWDR